MHFLRFMLLFFLTIPNAFGVRVKLNTEAKNQDEVTLSYLELIRSHKEPHKRLNHLKKIVKAHHDETAALWYLATGSIVPNTKEKTITVIDGLIARGALLDSCSQARKTQKIGGLSIKPTMNLKDIALITKNLYKRIGRSCAWLDYLIQSIDAAQENRAKIAADEDDEILINVEK